MRLKPLVTALCAGALLAATPFAQAKDLKSIGVTVGDTLTVLRADHQRCRAGSAQAGGR